MPWSAVYVSEVVPGALGGDAESVRAGLVALQAQAAAANRAAGLRGLLVCGESFFLQWLEGQEDAVRGLLARIATDKRHRRMQMLYSGPGEHMLDEWSMALLARPSADPQVAGAVEALRRGELPADGPGGVPAAIMRKLVKPGPEVVARPRVGLFGQSGVWSGALVAHLQARWETPLQRTRLLGSLGFEREALIEWLVHDDVEHGPLSVVNYSGELLAAPWMQGCIAPLGVGALFASGTTEEGVLGFARQVLEQLGAANAGTPLVAFLGRTATRFQPLLEALFAEHGRQVHWSGIPLADSAAVWKEIARCMPTAAAAAAAAPAAPGAVAVQAPAPTAPAASADGAGPEPAWLAPLLQVDGVEAAGLLPHAQATPLLRLRGAGRDAARHAAEIEAWRGGPHTGHDDELPQHWLVRWQDHLSLFRRLPDGALLYVATRPGHTNEPWLRLQVEAALPAGAGAQDAP
jgi:hypothetical protein